MSTAQEVVWAVHNFEAENPDEISFKAGEQIEVLERDDVFQDGWWTGRNIRGDTGLFPESYTSKIKPSKAATAAVQAAGLKSPAAQPSNPSSSTLPANNPAAPQANGSSTVLQSTLSDVDHALKQHEQNARRNSSDKRSIRSSRSKQSLKQKKSSSSLNKLAVPEADSVSLASQESVVNPVEDEEDHQKARQMLAARAKAQIDKAAEENKEKERARQIEDDRLSNLGIYNNYAIPIPGLELSDESSDEEVFTKRLSFPNSPKTFQKPASDKTASHKSVTPPPDRTGTPTKRASISALFASAMSNANGNPNVANTGNVDAATNNRGHSPSPSNSSRRSRKSMDAGIPPVPPVPAMESPSPSPEKQPAQLEPLASSRRSVSSRRSSTSSVRSKRSKSISVSPRPPSVNDLGASTASANANMSRDVSSRSPMEKSSPDTGRNPKSLTVKTNGTASAVVSPSAGKSPEDLPMPSSPGRASALRESLRGNHTPQPVESVHDDAPFSSYAPALATRPYAAVSEAAANAMPDPIPSPPLSSPAVSPPAEVQYKSISTPLSATTFDSRPNSQLGFSTSTNPNNKTSIRTVDTSPRSSLGVNKPSDPRQWNVEQVLDWGKSKGFDAITLSKFAEHEISGDVLLEMDVNSLKEIDLPAFGRRVHIFNGIKDLRRQIPVAGSIAQTPGVSPTMSGYEPDTPSTRANFSPRDTFSPTGLNKSTLSQGRRVSSTTQDSNQASPFSTMPDVGPAEKQPSLNHIGSSGQQLHGLGFDENGNETDSNDTSTASEVARATAMEDRLSPAKSNRTAGNNTHKRSYTEGTVGTYNTAYADSLNPVDEDAAEVLAERNAVTDSELVYPSSKGKHRGSQASVASKKDTIVSSSKKRASWYQRDDPMQSDTGAMTARQAQRSSKVPGSAFFTTGFRARKPAPRVTSSMSEFGSDKSPKQSQSKRSTRLFGFGSGNSAANSPSLSSSTASRVISEPIESGRTNMSSEQGSLKPPSAAGMERSVSDERVDDWRDQHDGHQVASAPNALQQIGKPELDGYLRKRGDRYNSWKTRYVVVKNANVYFMKSPKDARLKGWIPISGYKVVPDAEIARGYYGFKLVHPTLPWHYFSSEDPLVVRKFMKALMKSSIKRNEVTPVYQSSNIPTIPLEEAQAMFPPPRPPSPTSRDRAQKARLMDVNPNTLTAKDAQILMSLQKSPNMTASSSMAGSTLPPKSGRRESKLNILKASSLRGTNTPSVAGSRKERDFSGGSSASVIESPLTTPTTPQGEHFKTPVTGSDRRTSSGADRTSLEGSSPLKPQTTPRSQFAVRPEDAPLLQWVNARLPASSPPATSFTSSFRSGDILYNLTKNVSGKSSRKLDTAKFSLVDLDKGDSFELADPVFDLFDFFLELNVDTMDTSIADVLKGDEASTMRLVQSIKDKFDP